MSEEPNEWYANAKHGKRRISTTKWSSIPQHGKRRISTTKWSSIPQTWATTTDKAIQRHKCLAFLINRNTTLINTHKTHQTNNLQIVLNIIQTPNTVKISNSLQTSTNIHHKVHQTCSRTNFIRIRTSALLVNINFRNPTRYMWITHNRYHMQICSEHKIKPFIFFESTLFQI